jgi:hypothetical protein
LVQISVTQKATLRNAGVTKSASALQRCSSLQTTVTFVVFWKVLSQIHPTTW